MITGKYEIVDKRFIEGTDEHAAYREQLERTAKWQARRRTHKATASANQATREVVPVEWTKVDGVLVKRIGESKYVAAPQSGRKNARKFDVIDVEAREYVCQLNKGEVNTWLIRAL